MARRSLTSLMGGSGPKAGPSGGQKPPAAKTGVQRPLPTPPPHGEGRLIEGYVAVGIFGAPHGVKGELRLKSFTGDPLAIADYGDLLSEDGTRRFTLRTARPVKDDMLVVSVAGITDRDMAMTVTNTQLYAARAAMPAPEDDEFYHADLIGLRALSPLGELIGVITAVHDYGAGDILDIAREAGGPSLLIPFTKVLVPQVDLAAGSLTVIVPDETEGEDAPDDQSAL